MKKYGAQISVVAILLVLIAQVFCAPIAALVWRDSNSLLLWHFKSGKLDWYVTAQEMVYNIAQDTGILIFTLLMHKHFKLVKAGWPTTFSLLFILLAIVQYINDFTNPYGFGVNKLRWFVICGYLAFKWAWHIGVFKNRILKYFFD